MTSFVLKRSASTFPMLGLKVCTTTPSLLLLKLFFSTFKLMCICGYVFTSVQVPMGTGKASLVYIYVLSFRMQELHSETLSSSLLIIIRINLKLRLLFWEADLGIITDNFGGPFFSEFTTQKS